MDITSSGSCSSFNGVGPSWPNTRSISFHFSYHHRRDGIAVRGRLLRRCQKRESASILQSPLASRRRRTRLPPSGFGLSLSGRDLSESCADATIETSRSRAVSSTSSAPLSESTRVLYRSRRWQRTRSPRRASRSRVVLLAPRVSQGRCPDATASARSIRRDDFRFGDRNYGGEPITSQKRDRSTYRQRSRGRSLSLCDFLLGRILLVQIAQQPSALPALANHVDQRIESVQ